MLDRTEPGCRQLHRRARQHLDEGASRFGVVPADHLALTERFFAAAVAGDLSALEGLLAAGAQLVSDGGGQVSAARRPVVGPRKVASFVVGVTAKLKPGLEVMAADVNGGPSVLLLRGEAVQSVTQLLARDGRVHRILIVLAPAKLARLSRTGVLSRQQG